MKKTISYIAGIVSLLLLAGIAEGAATADCQPIYGGAGACEQNSAVTINKQVKNPETNAFVENLTINNPQYQPGETIIFKIMITNTSGGTIEKFDVYDFFPQYIDYVKGDGKYDQAKKILAITVDQLKSKETKTFMIEARAADKEKLPDDPQSRCVINQVSVKANNRTSQDNTLVCIAKDGTGTTFETKGDAAPTAAPKAAVAPKTTATPAPTRKPQPTAVPTQKAQATPAPTRKPQPTAAPKQNDQPTTTKGGLPIYEPEQTTTTPDTGPEAIALPGLASLLGLGFYMRSKART